VFTHFQLNCKALLKSLPKSHSRSCFYSAFEHLEKAKAISSIDPAMSIFRAITAEEEAASGLMYGLRELRYPKAEKLNPRNHVHKHAVMPFVRVLGLFHGQVFEKTLKHFRLHIKEEEGQRRLLLTFPVVVNGEDHWAYPRPPLNFGVREGHDGAPPTYESQITTYVQVHGANDILKYLKGEANRRNRLLYAAPQGFPVVPEPRLDILSEKASHVMYLLQAHLLIAPYEEIQPYVRDSIAAFLSMLGAVEREASAANEVSQETPDN
jgi:hypothetical protein